MKISEATMSRYVCFLRSLFPLPANKQNSLKYDSWSNTILELLSINILLYRYSTYCLWLPLPLISTECLPCGRPWVSCLTCYHVTPLNHHNTPMCYFYSFSQMKKLKFLSPSRLKVFWHNITFIFIIRGNIRAPRGNLKAA